MSKFILLTAAAVATATGTITKSFNDRTDQDFDEYLKSHPSKTYNDDETYQMRKLIWSNTRKDVIAQNEKYKKGDSTWWATMNKFADYTQDELQSIRGGKRAHFDESTNNFLKAEIKPSKATPKSISWMSVQSPVKNQGACGSCWAFATTEVLESHLAIAENSTQPLILAPQTLVNCVSNPKKCGGTGGCKGAIAEIGFNFTRDFSMALESDLPYIGQDEPCRKYKKTVTCKGYVKNKQNSAEDLEHSIATKGPVAVTVSANWALYGGGIFSGGCSLGASCTLDHAVVAVGYSPKYWLVRNSWGSDWGESGYIRLTRAHDTTTYSDTMTSSGSACFPYPAKQSPMGESGILFDTCYPVGVHRDTSE